MELFEQCLRALTLLGERHRSPQEVMDLIAQVDPPGTLRVSLQDPVSARDAEALRAATDRLQAFYGRKLSVHSAVASLILDFYARDTGQTRAAIIQRIALGLEEFRRP